MTRSLDFPGFRCCGGHELRPPETKLYNCKYRWKNLYNKPLFHLICSKPPPQNRCNLCTKWWFSCQNIHIIIKISIIFPSTNGWKHTKEQPFQITFPRSRQRDNGGFSTPSCARFKASRQPPFAPVMKRWRNS